MLEITMQDLVEVCDKCKGSGDPENPTPPTSLKELGQKTNVATPVCDCRRGGTNSGAKQLSTTGEVVRDFIVWLQRTSQLR
jgi:hypothetical protein